MNATEPKEAMGQPTGLLHVMLRVGELERSLIFYSEVLGMRLLRRAEFPESRFTLAFLGYADETVSSVVELTHNWDTGSYDLGDAFGHIALAVGDVYAATERARSKGAVVLRPAGPLKGKPEELIAFLQDPDGYRIELVQRASPVPH